MIDFLVNKIETVSEALRLGKRVHGRDFGQSR